MLKLRRVDTYKYTIAGVKEHEKSWCITWRDSYCRAFFIATWWGIQGFKTTIVDNRR